MKKIGVPPVVLSGACLFLSGCGSLENFTQKTDTESPAPEFSVSTAGHREPEDVCGFVDAVSPIVEGDGMVRIPPSHPDIRYAGRIDCGNPDALRFSHPGISIRVRFEGRFLAVLLDDFGVEEYPNYYNVVVDDNAPVVLKVSPDQQKYVLAEDLPQGIHVVEMVKRVEAGAGGNLNNGKGVFRGFVVHPGTTLLPLSPRPRRFEFIGDSIICGYGNEMSTMTPEVYPHTTTNSNATIAYGALVAAALGAEYMTVAYSGRGVMRNYADEPGKTMPEMYLDILPDDADPGRWEVARYTPELIVINLGTNDFSEGLPLDALPSLRASFEKEYGLFLDTLRRYYPDAVFILTVGPVLNDNWPKGFEALTSVRTILARIVSTRRAAGDRNLHFFVHAPQTPPYGEDWHPTAERHRMMADELLAFIDTLNIY